ncbi:uncharacterized protein [Watersipora subatra]|uniref:uncharacterized protein n=1 Tax=Watersipora subatra TaxID=2589382 RepID=UPI00355BDECE
MAQQVHYPSNPLQPGPVYFKTPRKCAVFGITDEAFRRQTNYLIDEAVHVGKGCNTIISYIHHYLEANQSQTSHNPLVLHADNCASVDNDNAFPVLFKVAVVHQPFASGQDKNNFMLMYLAWRVARGLNANVELNFMIAGHTKFVPDLFFGLFKRRYRREFVSSLHEVKECMERSSILNKAVLVGSQDGEVLVPTYDWSTFLCRYFSKIKGIKSAHQFTFTNETPGSVMVRQFCNSYESATSLIQYSPLNDEMPEKLTPLGMTRERKQYLYKEIREFCKEEHRDIVCPPVPPAQSHKITARPTTECSVAKDKTSIKKRGQPREPRKNNVTVLFLKSLIEDFIITLIIRFCKIL